MIHSGAVVGAGLPQVRVDGQVGWEGASLLWFPGQRHVLGSCLRFSWQKSIGSALTWLWNLMSVELV